MHTRRTVIGGGRESEQTGLRKQKNEGTVSFTAALRRVGGTCALELYAHMHAGSYTCPNASYTCAHSHKQTLALGQVAPVHLSFLS